jgi:signal transduction histidine kinase
MEHSSKVFALLAIVSATRLSFNMLLSLSIVLGAISIFLAVAFFRLQKKLAKQNAEIARLKRQGSEFVANVSHELKTPLTSIKGFTETLRSTLIKDPERSLDFLNRIEENAERLSHLINDILELSRFEQPNVYIEKTTFQIDQLLEEMRERFAHRLIQKKQIFAIEVHVEELHADRWLVDQCLSNLIENAHRYSGDESVIHIAVQPITEAGRVYTQIVVSDSGPGINGEDLPRIFERFYRGDKSRNRALGGTGLGLAIAKHILLSHGGFIRVESEAGKGARFLLYFPS